MAIYINLSDLFPEAGLAPAIGDRDRGPYLRWLAFYGSCFEPAMTDRAMKRDEAPVAMSPYGSFDLVVDTLTTQLRAGPYLLGTRFSAADVLWGGALNYMTMFGLLPERPEIAAYVERITSRPAFKAAQVRDEALIAKRQAATDKG